MPLSLAGDVLASGLSGEFQREVDLPMDMRFAVVLPSMAIGVLLGAPLMAQSGPAFDCAAASGDVEQLICSDEILAGLDRDLSARFDQALDAAAAQDPDSVRDLRATQRGWIGGRNECWKAQDMPDCVGGAYRSRIAILIARWELEQPRAEARWRCEADPDVGKDQEIVSTFFNTTPQSVRLELGDGVDIGLQVPTASGAQYAARFGSTFWTRGDEALYRGPDPDTVKLVCTLAGDP